MVKDEAEEYGREEGLGLEGKDAYNNHDYWSDSFSEVKRKATRKKATRKTPSGHRLYAIARQRGGAPQRWGFTWKPGIDSSS